MQSYRLLFTFVPRASRSKTRADFPPFDIFEPSAPQRASNHSVFAFSSMRLAPVTQVGLRFRARWARRVEMTTRVFFHVLGM